MKIIEEKSKRNYTFFFFKKKALELYYLKKKKFSHNWLRITLMVRRKWANAPFKKKNLAFFPFPKLIREMSLL